MFSFSIYIRETGAKYMKNKLILDVEEILIGLIEAQKADNMDRVRSHFNAFLEGSPEDYLGIEGEIHENKDFYLQFAKLCKKLPDDIKELIKENSSRNIVFSQTSNNLIDSITSNQAA